MMGVGHHYGGLQENLVGERCWGGLSSGGPLSRVPRAADCLQSLVLPHNSCLGAGSLSGMSQRRLSLRRHLVPLAPQRKPAGQQ